MHWRYGVVLTENCVMTHRSANLSYLTIPSPSLFVSQPPPAPDQSALVGSGPNDNDPLLLKIANDELTIWT